MDEKKEFNIKDYKVVDKLVRHLKKINKVILAIGIMIIISILFYSWRFIDKQFNGENVKVEKYLRDIYEFTFNVEELEVDKKGIGVYSAYCIEEPNIKFYIYKDKNPIIDDFFQRCRKYYLEKYENENSSIKDKLIIKENKQKFNGYEFFTEYEFWIEINRYEEIEMATETLYELHQYFYKNANIPTILLLGGEIRQQNIGYISNGAFEYDMTLEQLIYREKENYKKRNQNH